jgi:hypothetical protein
MLANHEARGSKLHPMAKRYDAPFGLLASIVKNTMVFLPHLAPGPMS